VDAVEGHRQLISRKQAVIARALALAGALVLFAAAPALAGTSIVNVQFQAFGPDHLQVLPGETVEWDNVSERRHTVTADDGSFDSGDLFSGQTFSHLFAAAGTYPYHCRVHAGMVGEIDAVHVILDPLPTAAIPAGQRVDFSGRTDDPSHAVRIERSTDGAFEAVGVAQPAADGAWHASLPATTTADFRAANDEGASVARRLLVSTRKILIRRFRDGIVATVTPADPYARVVVEQLIHERFGWWPVAQTRLDYVSQTTFRVRRRARLRVVLVDRDGWTPIVTSPAVTVLNRAPGNGLHTR
jgi:plastocyanin